MVLIVLFDDIVGGVFLKIPGIPNQFIPLIILFAAFFTALIVARDILVPDSFGDIGHYRADAVGEVASLDIVYAGADACADCHDDIYETKLNSNHRGVSCEVCHGPAANHIEDQEEFIPDAPRDRGDCELCHGYNMSRPSGFPPGPGLRRCWIALRLPRTCPCRD